MRVQPHDPSVVGSLVVIAVFVTVLTSFPTKAEECGSIWTRVNYVSDDFGLIFWAIANNGSRFIGVGDRGDNWTSTDGVTWTAQPQLSGLRPNTGSPSCPMVGTNPPYYEITYGGGLFVAVGWWCNIQTSPDGSNWTWRDADVDFGCPPSPSEQNLHGVVYDPDHNQFVAAGSAGIVTTSSDGVTWSAIDVGNVYFRRITYANQVYVAACGGGYVARSTNGTSWTSSKIADSHLFGCAYGNGMFVVVGYPGTIFTSTDNGINWTQQTAPPYLAHLWDVVYTGTHFVIAGQKPDDPNAPYPYPYNPILTSPDGVNWTFQTSYVTGPYLTSIDYMQTASFSRIVAGGLFGQITKSECPFEPFITQHPASPSPCENGPVELCVTVVGESPFTYQWARDTGSGWGDIGGAQSDCYSISSVSTSDAGDYRCRVWNTHGTVTSNSGTLTVRVAPKTFSEQPAAQDVCEFEAVQLCVTADGSPVLSYQWERDVGSGWVNAPNGYLSCLTINSVDPDADDGDYRCRVWNECGTLTSNEFTVTVIERAKADFDCDTDVDQDDFGHFQACLTGSGEPQTNLACIDAKLDADTDVDADDFAKFLNCLSGPGITAVVSCAD